MQQVCKCSAQIIFHFVESTCSLQTLLMSSRLDASLYLPNIKYIFLQTTTFNCEMNMLRAHVVHAHRTTETVILLESEMFYSPIVKWSDLEIYVNYTTSVPILILWELTYFQKLYRYMSLIHCISLAIFILKLPIWPIWMTWLPSWLVVLSIFHIKKFPKIVSIVCKNQRDQRLHNLPSRRVT